MSDFGQYVVGLAIIGVIAVADNFIFVESRVDPTPNDMIWISQSDFTTPDANNSLALYASTQEETAGFWIDTSFVSKAEYQDFLAETGYVGSSNVKPVAMIIDGSQSAPAQTDRIYALQPARNFGAQTDNPQYISQRDAIAFCHWQGMELSTHTQNQLAVRIRHSTANAATSADSTAHHAQLNGFRCVKTVN